MAILNKPDMNYGVWAEGGNIEIPSSEKVEQGWIIEKPLNETMNWLQNRQDRMLQYLNQRGIPEWDIRTEYPLGAFATRGNKVYESLSQNTDADPTLNPEIWKIAFVSYSDFIDYSEKVNSIENEDGYLAYYVKKSNPEMDAPCRGIEYNNISNSSGLRFSENTPEISASGVTIATFSGGTNPKDVVTHEQLAVALQTYKVGDIYITTSDSNPSIRFGYGTWERFAEGKTLVGISTSISNSIPEWVKFGGREFGDYNHKLVETELPAHTHDYPADDQLIQAFDLTRSTGFQRSGYDATSELTSTFNSGWAKTSSRGGNVAHNNVQPSIVVYFWKRIS